MLDSAKLFFHDLRMKHTLLILLTFCFIVFLITAFWNQVSSTILPNTTMGLYDKDFFQNMLINAHGSAIDILLISIILYWFEQRKKKNEDIKDIIQELAYLKHYKGDDISYRYFGRLKKIHDMGENQVDLPSAQIYNIDIKEINLINSNLIAANFKNSIISNSSFKKCNLEATQFIDCKIISKNTVIFEECNLIRANFYKAQLKGIDFRSCQLTNAKFDQADLSSADFRNVDCKGMSFKNANLRSTNFMGAMNLTQEMLNEAKNIKYIKR
ncbi:Pentapeptide repeat-containing protein [Acinetobacter bohemicus]|uniref:Pentapeptide repeat-containing protein n=2 Tax=Acinetobacter bohemicus TaxID=1435036 RepID=A0A1I6W953_9GAMM|nr:Pentapeptide repeat-containing protein [Acinetobacter bohemicus]